MAKSPKQNKHIIMLAKFSGEAAVRKDVERRLNRVVESSMTDYEKVLKQQVLHEFPGSEVSLMSVGIKKPRALTPVSKPVPKKGTK